MHISINLISYKRAQTGQVYAGVCDINLALLTCRLRTIKGKREDINLMDTKRELKEQ